MSATRNVVVVLNSNPDVIDMLRVYLERSGFVVFAAPTRLFRNSQLDFDGFIRDHDPDVIVYDIAPPYDQSWALFKHFRDRPVCRDITFVLTTTSIAHVREIAGAQHVFYEIVGKPYDLVRIVRAVKEAAHTRPVNGSHADDRRAAERRRGPRNRRKIEDRRG
jgi:CheY-like chemotaxis protein